jgi:hypothetical protein
MKRNAAGDFCVLYVEPTDEKAAILSVILEQKKPIVIMLAEQARVFQRPEDYTDLKHIKRRLDLPIVFVIPQSEHLTLLAGRHGFPVYLSMDALADAVAVGQLGRQRTLNRTTTPLASSSAGLLSGRANATGQLGADAPLSGSLLSQSRATRQLGTREAEKEASPVATAPVFTPPIFSPKKTVPLTPPGLDSLQPLQPIRSADIKTDALPPYVAYYPTYAASAPSAASPTLAEELRPLHVFSPPQTNGAASTPDAEPITRQTTRPLVSEPTVPPARPTQKRPSFSSVLPTRPAVRRVFIVLLVVLLVVTLIGAGIASVFALFPQATTSTSTPAASPVVGHVTFLSSEQVSENSDQGLDDEVLVDLTHVPNPAPRKSYYAWLLSDLNQGDTVTLLLGTLRVSQGNAHLLYTGDAQHTNLLAIASRFLVTEEDSAVPPIAPSPDYTTWRYYGAFAQNTAAAASGMGRMGSMSDMGNMTQYSFLDHLRHLLASDPMLNQLELPGGLNTWLYRNTGKVVEWTGGMPDAWQENKDAAFIRRQALRTLTYLDGLSFVKQDIPATMSLTSPGIDEHLASVGLLTVDGMSQVPPSYLDSINAHLNGLLQTAPRSANLRTPVAGVVEALSNVEYWLQMVRQDAKQIVTMSDAQLLQSTTLTLLNDMMNNAMYAYVGQSDASTGAMREGVVWIYHQIQTLATLDVTAYTAHSSSMQLIPGHEFPMAERSGLPGAGGNS